MNIDMMYTLATVFTQFVMFLLQRNQSVDLVQPEVSKTY